MRFGLTCCVRSVNTFEEFAGFVIPDGTHPDQCTISYVMPSDESLLVTVLELCFLFLLSFAPRLCFRLFSFVFVCTSSLLLFAFICNSSLLSFAFVCTLSLLSSAISCLRMSRCFSRYWSSAFSFCFRLYLVFAFVCSYLLSFPPRLCLYQLRHALRRVASRHGTRAFLCLFAFLCRNKIKLVRFRVGLVAQVFRVLRIPTPFL
jgi:hypothetical protein